MTGGNHDDQGCAGVLTIEFRSRRMGVAIARKGGKATKRELSEFALALVLEAKEFATRALKRRGISRSG